MNSPIKLTGIFLSNFNLQNFVNYIDNDTEFPLIKTTLAPYGQVMNILLGDNMAEKYDFGFIWLMPQAVIGSFNKLINGHLTPFTSIMSEVDDFCNAVIKYSEAFKFLFIVSWSMPSYYRGIGLRDLKSEFGISNCLMRMNLRLADNFDARKDIYLLDSQKWIGNAGEDAFNPKLWYLSKTPFNNTVFKQALKELKSAVKTISGDSKKMIILDLDDTLWGGIVGDTGWENIKLGGHDFTGEAFVEFQTALKALKEKGILLAIVSKNEEAIALEAIMKHPEMILKKDDFIGWEINWDDKSKNILNLLKRVNIGPQSVVFIDDNPVERDRIRQSIPEVFVPEWPANKLEYTRALHKLNCFDIDGISNEDLERTKLYLAENDRNNLKSELNSIDDWLESLKTVVIIETLNNRNLQRTAQLMNKTNQMNLITRRLTETELLSWANQNNHNLWTFSISDKFGNSGLTGILSIESENKTIRIFDFILSCRVMGRKIEEIMLKHVIQYSKKHGMDKIIANYLPTPKNKPCLDFWISKSGFTFIEKENSFLWDLSKPVPEIANIEVINYP
ncbi:MAG: HAD-IIIC family phosphatase [Ignavibacteriaceae bacterium]